MFLKLQLQYFSADEGGTGGADSGSGDAWFDGGTGEPVGGSETKQTSKEETTIPKKRFDDVNNRYKALTEDYNNRQTEYDDMVKQLEASGNSMKELEETIDAGVRRIDALEGVLNTMLEAELTQIDEEYHELVPKDKPIEEQLKWLATAKQKGLFGSRGIEFEIGGMSNPKAGGKGQKGYDGMSAVQLLTMGYSK